MDTAKSEAFVRIAPRSVPRINSYDHVSRSPVLVVSTGTTFFHLDLEELTPEEAAATVTRMRSALEVYAGQLAEWQERAAMDACGPYVFPPVPYGIPGDVPDGDVTDGDVPAGEGGDAGDGPAGDAR